MTYLSSSDIKTAEHICAKGGDVFMLMEALINERQRQMKERMEQIKQEQANESTQVH